MQDRRQRWAWTHRYAVPMFVASLVAVILSGSGLVAVMVFGNGDRPGNNGTGTGIDPCVSGTWNLVSYTENNELGSGEMVAGTPVFTFEEEGAGLADFGGGIMMEVESFVGTATGEIAGQITYQWETSDQALEFVGQESNATITSDQELSEILGPGEFTLPEGPLDYTCDGDVMAITDGDQSFEYERVG